MVRTQIYLEEEQAKGLRRLAARTRCRQRALIREAIDRLLAEAAPATDWQDTLDKTVGIWADRGDLDDILASGRRSVEERLEHLWR